jgi:pSer/pThr/pTyr-binding forkhead associated (FHA) protein
MRVQLIVIQGKPEGKVIPLAGPVFKIGRGERCHLRPNSERVSREHAELQITPDKVTIRDLGSRNGTLINGKALREPVTLKDRDLVQIGPLTFAVSIQDAPMATKAAAKPRKPASSDDVAPDEIESWLIADNANPTPDRPSGVYGGETITITTFKGDTPPKPPAAPASAPTEKNEDIFDKLDEEENEETLESPAEEMPEELIDESNPFYAKKNQPAPTPAKPAARDTSDVASEILRKLMERRRGSK